MAEALFRTLVAENGGYEIRSAGVSAAPGQPASGHTQEILLEQGISVDGFQSSPLSEELVGWATHIVGMTRDHIEAVILAPAAVGWPLAGTTQTASSASIQTATSLWWSTRATSGTIGNCAVEVAVTSRDVMRVSGVWIRMVTLHPPS